MKFYDIYIEYAESGFRKFIQSAPGEVVKITKNELLAILMISFHRNGQIPSSPIDTIYGHKFEVIHE